MSDRSVVCGNVDYPDTINFYDTSGNNQGTLVSTDGERFGFVVIWNADGSYAWSAKIEGGVITPRQIVTDSAGNITVRGDFQDTVRIYGADNTLGATKSSSAGIVCFIAQWGRNGQFRWLSMIDYVPVSSGRVFSLTISDMDIYQNDPVILGHFYTEETDVFVQYTDPVGAFTNKAVPSFNTLIFLIRVTSTGEIVFMSTARGFGTMPTPVTTLFTYGLSIQDTIRWGGYGAFFTLTFYDTADAPVVTPPYTGGLPTYACSFFSSYDPAGTPQWAVVVNLSQNSIGNQFLGELIYAARAIDSYQNFTYFTGPFNNTIQFNDGSTTPLQLSTMAPNGLYIVKVDSTPGTCVWTTTIDFSGNNQLLACHADVNGNGVYVLLQQESSTLTYYDAANPAVAGTTTLPSGDITAFVLISYSSAGVFRWARIIGGIDRPGLTMLPARLIQDTTAAKNLVVLGTFSGSTLRFYAADGTTVVKSVTSTGDPDAFVAKYDTAGQFLWTSRVSGTGSEQGTWGSPAAQGDIYGLNSYTSDPVSIVDAQGATRYTLPGFLVQPDTYYKNLSVARWPSIGY